MATGAQRRPHFASPRAVAHETHDARRDPHSLGHESVHQRDEAGVVGQLQEMNPFVHNNVFETFRWLLDPLSYTKKRQRTT